MSVILFPALRDEPPDVPWWASLCSHCGHVTLDEPGEHSPSCSCLQTGPAATILLLVPEREAIWRQLTPHVPDHVIGRVIRVMYGQEAVPRSD